MSRPFSLFVASPDDVAAELETLGRNMHIRAYDIFVGIIWRRFGTPTGLC